MSVKNTNVFGITEDVAKGILEAALATGGEFAEVYIESSANEVLLMRERKLANANASKVMGAAVRVIKDGTEVNASVTDFTPEKLLATAKVLADSFEGEKSVEVLPFAEKEVPIVVDPKYIRGEDYTEELKLLNGATEGAYSCSPEIVQVMANLTKRNREYSYLQVTPPGRPTTAATRELCVRRSRATARICSLLTARSDVIRVWRCSRALTPWDSDATRQPTPLKCSTPTRCRAARCLS